MLLSGFLIVFGGAIAMYPLTLIRLKGGRGLFIWVAAVLSVYAGFSAIITR